jgi:nucleotide-binding universal stress UspA family protein
MAFEDVLLHLDSYPDATPVKDIDQAVAFASAVGGKLTALALAVTIPLESNRLSDLLVGLSSMIAEEQARSDAACRAGLAHFKAAATAAGVFASAIQKRTDLYAVPEVLAREARTRDLCIVPLGKRYSGQAEVAQTAMFDGGRPVLVFRGDHSHFDKGIGDVVISWDGAPCAARAVAEALPILSQAETVRILIVTGEKPTVHSGSADDLVRHLQAHGIEATVDEVDAKGRKIGDVMEHYVTEQRPDLLVMGAYGHSRLREFILGGATEHAISKLKVPTLFSH